MLMKKLAPLLLLCTLVACATEMLVHDTRPVMAQRTWHIEAPKKAAGGTAFPVQCVEIEDGLWQTLFLTAAHLGSEEIGWKVKLNEDEDSLLKGGVLLSKHLERDALLVLFVSEDPIPIMPVSAERPDIGDELWLVGYPKLRPFLITRGIYSGIFEENSYVSAAIYLGNSGGPVLDSTGSAVGIVTGIEQDQVETQAGDYVLLPLCHVTYFTPISLIAEWLEGFGIH